MAYVTYLRVSTKRQGESGLGLESQQAILDHYLTGKEVVANFVEVGSAKDMVNRPQLQQALALCRDNGHTLAVAKIDRLSRKTEHALQVWGELDGRLFSADIPQENGKMDKFVLTIFMAIADRERELIGIRTKAALEAAKARGQELGTVDNLTDNGRKLGQKATKAKAINAYQTDLNYIKMLRETEGVKTYAAIADRLNKDGKTTRNGKPYQAMTVKRILDRA